MQVQDLKLRKKLKIVNVVCTADIKQKVNIVKFIEFPWGIYDEAIYHGKCGYVKIPGVQGRVAIFISGKMISVGSKSVNDAKNKLQLAKFYLVTNKFIQDTTLRPVIRNIVATCSFGITFDLEKLAHFIPGCSYEPEKFPGLIYNIHDSVTCLLFASGKAVIVGSRSIEELNSAYFDLQKMI